MIKGVTSDSRKVKKGYVFVAVKGLTHDGHDFINEAVENGAIEIVGEKPRPKDLDKSIKYTKVNDSRETLGEIISRLYNNPSKKLKIIGVTGTKGKTTTAHMIFHILNKLDNKVGLISSIHVIVGGKVMDTGFHVTTPEIEDLYKYLNEMTEANCKYAVIEVSSHGISQKRIAGLVFEVGVLTNVAPEHLDYHKRFQEYRKLKQEFVNSCKKQVVSPKKTKINIFPSTFNNLNAESAVLTCQKLGFDRKKCIQALRSFKLPKGRMEKVDNNKGITIYIDFAHTPDSMEAVLSHLKKTTKNKLIVVFGAAGERDAIKRPAMGKTASKYADIIILTSEDPRSENVNDIIDQIKSGISDNGRKIYKETDRYLAIRKALLLAGKNDTVAILGKGCEKSMNMDGKTETPWSDNEAVKKVLLEL